MPLFFYDPLLEGRASRTRIRAYSVALCSCAVLLFYGQARAATRSHRQSSTAYARAEKIHLRLEEKPAGLRMRGDYERALDAYRAVYHRDPASPDAGRSIAAVAELLAGEGRCFHDDKLLHDAVAQWEFLRHEYPESPLRQQALLQEGQIEQRDLHDRATARKLYRVFLMRYPQDLLAPQARAGLRGQPSAETAIAHGVHAGAASLHGLHAQTTPFPARREDTVERKPVEFAADAPLAWPASTSRIANANPAETRPLTEAKEGNPPQAAATIQGVRFWLEGKSTRIAVDMSRAVPCRAYPSPDGRQITLVFFGSQPANALTRQSIVVPDDENLRALRVSALTGNQTALVLQLSHAAGFSSFQLSGPARWIVDLHPAGTAPAPQLMARTVPVGMTRTVGRTGDLTQSRSASTVMRQTAPLALPEQIPSPSLTANRQSSMTRVLGLRIRRIVIDAGHGGHDSGTLGPDGLEEKDVALHVALRLGRLLHQRLGADVVYTRRTDVFVPLEERTAIANQAHADLFLSIHANSSSDPDVRGVETYYLNFTASPDAQAVAARENATSNRSVYELSDLVRKITLSDKIDESREFADDIQQSLYGGLAGGNAGIKDRGVKQAPFVVLIGANMPSILAEISFLTNAEDARELARPAYRERLAEALYRGVAQYVDGMSGVRIANTAQPEALAATAE